MNNSYIIPIIVVLPTIVSIVLFVFTKKEIYDYIDEFVIKRSGENVSDVSINRCTLFIPSVFAFAMYYTFEIVLKRNLLDVDVLKSLSMLFLVFIFYYLFYLAYYFQSFIIAKDKIYIFGPATLFRVVVIEKCSLISVYRTSIKAFIVSGSGGFYILTPIQNGADVQDYLHSFAWQNRENMKAIRDCKK